MIPGIAPRFRVVGFEKTGTGGSIEDSIILALFYKIHNQNKQFSSHSGTPSLNIPRVAGVRSNSPTHKFDVKPHLLRSLLVKKVSSKYGVRLTHTGRTTGPVRGNAGSVA
ncbi:hypothetical protein ElyMa_005728900 [Elysia marginata]|uniref:Uncharacterized protein n=1 Tax=Elysia marginata TaxID=1093978 RepID=A0AAV4FJ88_9GAST|nr:hypothetical protein ElyMa_005728900 [Elysia marginata]